MVSVGWKPMRSTEIKVRLVVALPNREAVTVCMVADTGYTGTMCLSNDAAKSLGLKKRKGSCSKVFLGGI